MTIITFFVKFITLLPEKSKHKNIPYNLRHASRLLNDNINNYRFFYNLYSINNGLTLRQQQILVFATSSK
jgi:hypothetical protein